MKTKETLELEELLFKSHGHKLGEYSCFEVTFGTRDPWSKGTSERVDFVSYENQGNTFRCYEIKVSKPDFMSNAKKTFSGDFNYFVMPRELWNKLTEENNELLRTYLFSGVGVIIPTIRKGGLEVVRKPKRKNLALHEKFHMLESMMKSMSRYVRLEDNQ
ncbi:hypothetical protein [Lactococcus lactis]|uniref:hypothetical protein n=1 Tax=Lactococcus lactis TaxID=1358 RepID=UPI00288EA2EB|nr:hypothetical protein [Lactococcus lactis]MDT2903339.1 hypothetical protein [Lactococcus lactis]